MAHSYGPSQWGGGSNEHNGSQEGETRGKRSRERQREGEGERETALVGFLLLLPFSLVSPGLWGIIPIPTFRVGPVHHL